MYIGDYQGTMQSQRVYSEKKEYTVKKESFSLSSESNLFDTIWEKEALGKVTKPSKRGEDQKQSIRVKCAVYLLELLYRTRRGKLWSDELVLKELPQSNTYSKITQTYHYEELETTDFSAQGKVVTRDGKELTFQFGMTMSRSFKEFYASESIQQEIQLCDPLVINLDTDIAEVLDQKFLFDLDTDGSKESVSSLSSGSGYLAVDKNQDGVINDGSELFGTATGDGFSELGQFDSDKNGWIDEGDEVWKSLQIWCMDSKGNSHLYKLAEKGLGAISLQHVDTMFSLNSSEENTTNARIRKTGIFLYENGGVGTVQHVDLAK